jgi:AcrR family transcriptional regulator
VARRANLHQQNAQFVESFALNRIRARFPFFHARLHRVSGAMKAHAIAENGDKREVADMADTLNLYGQQQVLAGMRHNVSGRTIPSLSRNERPCARIASLQRRKGSGVSTDKTFAVANGNASKTPSLRDARKLRTKRALKVAALKLFATQGYEPTTTEEIAEKAGVSARTFFRYYPTKESVLFEGEGLWLEAFADRYFSKPEDLSDLDAICASLVELAPIIVRRRTALRLYERSVATSPILRGLKYDQLEESIGMVAAAIAARRGLKAADEASLLLASIVNLAHRRALELWLAGPADEDLGQIIIAEFGLVTAAFAPPEAGRTEKPKGRSVPLAPGEDRLTAGQSR